MSVYLPLCGEAVLHATAKIREAFPCLTPRQLTSYIYDRDNILLGGSITSEDLTQAAPPNTTWATILRRIVDHDEAMALANPEAEWDDFGGGQAELNAALEASEEELLEEERIARYDRDYERYAQTRLVKEIS